MAMGKFSFTRTARGESVVTRDVSELRDDPARLADGFEQFVKGGKTDETYETKLTPIANGAASEGARSRVRVLRRRIRIAAALAGR